MVELGLILCRSFVDVDVQDVVLHVPMETLKDVERIKQAMLAIEGKVFQFISIP